MTKSQANEIRNLVDTLGWAAVRNHPVLGKVWKESLRDSANLSDLIDN